VLLAQSQGGSGGPTGPAPSAQGPGPAAPTPPEPRPPQPTPPRPPAPTPPKPPVETAEQRRAREEAERRAAEAAKAERAREAFVAAEEFARASWENKPEVVRRYRLFAADFPDAPEAKEATRRADGIARGVLHPHPDRKYAEASALEQAKAAWEAARAKVEEAIAARRYDDALRLVPPAAEDREGVLAEEMHLYREVARRLVDFHDAVAKQAAALKPDQRSLTVAKGKGTVVRFTVAGPQVKVGSDVLDVAWADLPPAEIASLAQRAFEGKELRFQEMLAVYAWAHRVRDAFYASAIGVKMASASSGSGGELAERLLARAKDRFGK
jgi:hypothetical protein